MLENIGYCGRRNGVLDQWIENKQACEDAAVTLGLADTTAGGTGGNGGFPYGCYYKLSAKALYWGLDGNKNNDDTDRVSVCGAGMVHGPWHPWIAYARAPAH